MPRLRERRPAAELASQAAAAILQQEQQQQQRATRRRTAVEQTVPSAVSQQQLLPISQPVSAGIESVQELYRRAASLQQAAAANLGVEVMSYGSRSQAGAGAPHGLHPSANRVPSTPLSSMAYAGPPMSATQRGYSAVASAAGLSMPYGTAAVLSQQQLTASYPINPDVKVKKLPFYEIMAELLKPSTLAPQGSGRYQESSFCFSLTPVQANKIANSRDLRPNKQDYSVQVQMRFCLLETSCEQEDNFPPNVAVKINDKMCPLPSPIPTNKPGVEPKRPSRPVNITALCRISPTVTNRVQVSWASEFGRCWVISIYLVQKLSSDDLLQKLKLKGARIPDFTRSLIKQKLNEDGDCEIATTSLKCSLMCPLGKMRMLLPCRAGTCDHLQCFDASLYLQMNERKPTWTCPVCDKPALYETLVIDGYFQEVLRLNSTSNDVNLHKDGSWTPMVPKKERPEPTEKRKSIVAIETLSDSDDESCSAPTASALPAPKEVIDDSVVEEVPSGGPLPSTAPLAKRKASDVEIITLESSSEEDDDDDDDDDADTNPPPAKRPYIPEQASASAVAAAADNPPELSAVTNGSTTVVSVAPSVDREAALVYENTPESSHISTTPVISASVASSLAQLPATTSVLPATNYSAPPSEGITSVPAAVVTPVPPSAINAGSPVASSEASKSDNTWSVVDSGKRLIFRKSMSCSSNGTSATTAATSGSGSSSVSAISTACELAVSTSSASVSSSSSCSSSTSVISCDVKDGIEAAMGPSLPSHASEDRVTPLADENECSGALRVSPRPTRTSSRSTRFQGITWEGDSETSSDEDGEFCDNDERESRGDDAGTHLDRHFSGGRGRRGRGGSAVRYKAANQSSSLISPVITSTGTVENGASEYSSGNSSSM